MTYIKKLVLKGFKSFARETEIDFTNSMNSIVGPNGSGKSARWDTEVLLASGDKKPIGEIVEESLKKSNANKKIDDGFITEENPLGIKVLSINPKTMKIEESEVQAFMKREGEPNLYTIKTNTGKEVTTTSCHPVMIYRNGGLVSEIVENLKQGDFIATPNIINLKEGDLNLTLSSLTKNFNQEEFARFLGYIVGDGCIIPNRRIDFVNAELEIIKDYSNIANNLGFKVSIKDRNKSVAKNIYLNSSRFSKDLINLFENKYKKEGKHIPKQILFSKKHILKNFLAALFDCDASVRKDNPTFEYVTMSEELANNVILGLLRFGIVARKSKKLKCATNSKLKNKKEYFFISVEGKEKISNLYDNIPLKCHHKKELLKKWAENPIEPNTNNDLLPLEVNGEIKKIMALSGIKLKPIRKKYPFLMAYVENRCNASRKGLAKIIPLIEEKLSVLIYSYNNIQLNQMGLINCMTQLNISGQKASDQIGINKCVIMRDWATGRFNPKKKNLQNFYFFIKNILSERILKIKLGLNLLKNLASSDIFWDRINKIEKVKGEEWVYDLCVEKDHNFIANSIFVHNSNITDAICFVLGRMSIKSMRAAKASNLIFTGTKEYRPAGEASVKLVFDNSDKKLPLLDKEIIIERAVRRGGQGIYRINNENKTRQDVIELLSQGGIDPYGFNIVLQGEIDSIIRMPSEDRRKVIEEVAGISIYELRKEKSLHELEKTEEKIKEVSATLRERISYLRNLEEERKQALRFQKLKQELEKSKASIIFRKLNEKEKELEKINLDLEKKDKEKLHEKEKEQDIRKEIAGLEGEIEKINSQIRTSSGIQQENLNREISDLRAELAGLNVRKDNNQEKLEENLAKKQKIESELASLRQEIEKLRKEFPSQRKKQEELEKKKAELEEAEKARKIFYNIKEKLNTIKDKLKDKEREIQKCSNQGIFLLKETDKISENLSFKDLKSCNESILKLKTQHEEKIKEIEKSNEEIKKHEKTFSVSSAEISNLQKIKSQVTKLDICPLCKSKITKEHIAEVFKECNEKISPLNSELEKSKKELSRLNLSSEELKNQIADLQKEFMKAETDSIKLKSVEEKKENLKALSNEEKILHKEFSSLESERNNLQKKILSYKDIEESHHKIFMEMQEISSRTEENINAELEFKERDLDSMKLRINQMNREEEEIKEELEEFEKEIEEKQNALEKKEEENSLLEKKFEKLNNIKRDMEKKIHDFNSALLKIQNQIYIFDTEINNLKVESARLNAEKENFETDFAIYRGVGIINLPVYILEEKLSNLQKALDSLGNVNLRALEVYDKIKEDYDKVAEKVSVLKKEKEEILKIISEIDKKKKKTFMKTLIDINGIFNRNFSQLYAKGEAFLELENPEEPFAAGLDITIKVGRGKYFDVHSLSGGEKTLVALSLIFAIQEYKPYSFYIFDEVDATLDKRNSERVASLIKKYMKTGQYIVVTHNDAIISESPILYGVSMQEGISKILSLEI